MGFAEQQNNWPVLSSQPEFEGRFWSGTPDLKIQSSAKATFERVWELDSHFVKLPKFPKLSILDLVKLVLFAAWPEVPEPVNNLDLLQFGWPGVVFAVSWPHLRGLRAGLKPKEVVQLLV